MQSVSCLLLRVASRGGNRNDGYVTVIACDFGFACGEVSCNSHRKVSQFYHFYMVRQLETSPVKRCNGVTTFVKCCTELEKEYLIFAFILDSVRLECAKFCC